MSITPPEYHITRWPHGWTLDAVPGRTGIPMKALSEAQAMFPPDAVMANGVVNHLRKSGHPDVVMCVADPESLQRWHEEIDAALQKLKSPGLRWWMGLHIGLSSAVIFSVLENDSSLRAEARVWSGSATPKDADDFGRCSRLVDEMPGWKERLGEVAAAFPDGAWPAIVAKWDELCRAEPAECTRMLRRLGDPGK